MPFYTELAIGLVDKHSLDDQGFSFSVSNYTDMECLDDLCEKWPDLVMQYDHKKFWEESNLKSAAVLLKHGLKPIAYLTETQGRTWMLDLEKDKKWLIHIKKRGFTRFTKTSSGISVGNSTKKGVVIPTQCKNLTPEVLMCLGLKEKS